MSSERSEVKRQKPDGLDDLPEMWAERAGLMAANAVRLGVAGAVAASAKAKTEATVLMDCAMSLKKRLAKFERQPFHTTAHCRRCGGDIELNAAADDSATAVVMVWIEACACLCRDCLEEKSEESSQLSEVTRSEG